MGYRDDRGPARQRIAELEERLAALEALREPPARPPYAELALSVVAGGALAVLGMSDGRAAAIAAGAGVILAALVLFAAGRRSRAPARAPAASAGQAPPPATVVALDDRGDHELPVSFEVPGELEGVRFEVRESTLSVYDDRIFYLLAAGLTNTGRSDIETFRARLELVDSNGRTWPSRNEPFEGMDELGDAPARPGDEHVFDHLLSIEELPRLREERAGIVAARLTLLGLGLAAPGPYPPVKPLEVALKVAPIPNLELRFRERARTKWSQLELLDLELENAGTTAVGRLDLSVRYHLADGSQRDDDIVNQVTYRARPIRPGEVRACRLRAKLSDEVVRWEPLVVGLSE